MRWIIRFIFRDEIYVITNVDHMNFKKKCLKFSCRKVRKKLECENDFGDINSDDGYGAFAFPHIEPAEQRAAEMLEREVEAALK